MAHNPATRYELLSLLLSYPSDEMLAASDEVVGAVAALPGGRARDLIRRFVDPFFSTRLLVLQQRYVETFDLERRASLHLTFYSHGDTRRRGQELLRLKRLYRAAGFILDGGELPDYLPLVLELAANDAEGGAWVLREHRAGLELLHRHLSERNSPYADLTEAIRAGLPRLDLAGAAEVARLLAAGPPREEVGLEPFAPPEVMPTRGVHS